MLKYLFRFDRIRRYHIIQSLSVLLVFIELSARDQFTDVQATHQVTSHHINSAGDLSVADIHSPGDLLVADIHSPGDSVTHII